VAYTIQNNLTFVLFLNPMSFYNFLGFCCGAPLSSFSLVCPSDMSIFHDGVHVLSVKYLSFFTYSLGFRHVDKHVLFYVILLLLFYFVSEGNVHLTYPLTFSSLRR